MHIVGYLQDSKIIIKNNQFQHSRPTVKLKQHECSQCNKQAFALFTIVCDKYGLFGVTIQIILDYIVKSRPCE